MLAWLTRRLHHSREIRANRHERRAMTRLTALPRAELQIVISQLRRLTPACQTRILEGLPEWQQQALRQALRRRR